jgi:hypothetical protein
VRVAILAGGFSDLKETFSEIVKILPKIIS